MLLLRVGDSFPGCSFRRPFKAVAQPGLAVPPSLACCQFFCLQGPSEVVLCVPDLFFAFWGFVFGQQVAACFVFSPSWTRYLAACGSRPSASFQGRQSSRAGSRLTPKGAPSREAALTGSTEGKLCPAYCQPADPSAAGAQSLEFDKQLGTCIPQEAATPPQTSLTGRHRTEQGAVLRTPFSQPGGGGVLGQFRTLRIRLTNKAPGPTPSHPTS